MSVKKIVLTIVNLLVLQVSFASAFPSTKITVKAVDEQGFPLVGARVSMAFTIPKPNDFGTADLFAKGVTDKDGVYSAESESIGTLGFSVDDDGFYQSSVGYEFKSSSNITNRWEPWNPTVEVMLKKKRNPVPMYDNHRTSYNVPKLDTPIGFDLEKEDWVAPYGKGTTSDFIINFNVVDRAYTDYECGFTLTFSNPHDGIQEYFFDSNDQSSFKWPFEAPDVGYLAQLSKRKTMTPGKGYNSDEKNNVNYLFRVRTIVDQNGNIIEAKYGKLVGEFGFVPNKQITFRYIFNPDGTRNLEEDPEKNLFGKK